MPCWGTSSGEREIGMHRYLKKSPQTRKKKALLSPHLDKTDLETKRKKSKRGGEELEQRSQETRERESTRLLSETRRREEKERRDKAEEEEGRQVSGENKTREREP